MPQYAILLYPPAPADWAEATPEALAAYQRWAEQVEELGCKPEPTPSGEVVLAAGDIANCHAQGDEATAELVEGIDGTVLALGDEAYPKGTQANFEQCYNPSWGRFKER